MNAFEIFYNQLIVLEGYKKVLIGLKNTAVIAVLGLLIGMILGCLFATCKILPRKGKLIKVLSAIVDTYVAIFRGTPMVVQLLLGYFVLLPMLGIVSDAIIVAIIIF